MVRGWELLPLHCQRWLPSLPHPAQTPGPWSGVWSSSGPLQLLHRLAAAPQSTPIWDLLLCAMGLRPLLFIAPAVGPLAAGGTLAQQPVQPLPRLGGCPLGFYASGNTCLSSPGSKREAIEKVGTSCPLGWFTSGSYCIKSR